MVCTCPDVRTVVPALSLAVLGARAAGKVILDGVFNTIADEAGFRAEAQQGREMGFDGKTLIHPSQVVPANEVFGPSEKELADARKIVSAYEAGPGRRQQRHHRRWPHDRKPARARRAADSRPR